MTHAATEEIDGHQYAVLDVYSNTSAETLRSFVINNQYAKIVLQSDWTYGDRLVINAYSGNGNNGVILDLHGHTFAVPQNKTFTLSMLQHIEIWDSSATGTGQIICCYMVLQCTDFTHAVIRGGTINTAVPESFHMETRLDGAQSMVTMYGGKISGKIKFSVFYNNQAGSVNLYGGTIGGVFATDYSTTGGGGLWQVAINIAPYLLTDASGAVRPYDAYAVSTTPYATGVSNYAYGLAWDIDVGELQALAIPTDKAYYLWAREPDGQYEYLNCVYIDGAWRNAA